MARLQKSPSRASDAIKASELVRHEWRGRIEAEYRSAAITQQITLWLIQIGASPDLIRAGLRIVDDELAHAELAHEVLCAAGGAETTPILDRNTLGVVRAFPILEHDVTTTIVRVFCLGETVAVPLFSNLRKGASVAVARHALDRILKDEVRHRDFGWLTLGWLLERPDASELRALITQSLPRWISELEKNYGVDLDNGIGKVTASERAWGIAPWKEYSAILHRSYDRDYRPRFADVGITWQNPRS